MVVIEEEKTGVDIKEEEGDFLVVLWYHTSAHTRRPKSDHVEESRAVDRSIEGYNL